MDNISTPPLKQNNTSKKKVRDSNLELYRIIVMLLIVAHHYVVNSGLIQMLQEVPLDVPSSFMVLFGAWGKTGIDCFILITGYFMCKSNFSWNKLLKLYLQIVFYTMIIYGIFCVTGHETLSLKKIILRLRPVWEFRQDFVSCFMMFYLFIPFLNILINHLNRQQHLTLTVLLLIFYSVLPSFPYFKIDFNYVSWFMALYMIASYIRLYGLFPRISHWLWGIITFALIITGSISVIIMYIIYKIKIVDLWAPYFFMADSNRIIPVLIAISSFMYFKDLKIPHSRLINAVGGATFGVLLIHANSNAMRTWLWRETVDCVGNYKDDVIWTLGYAIGCVLIIFISCAGIDWFRGRFIEPKLLTGVKRLLSPIRRKINGYKLLN